MAHYIFISTWRIEAPLKEVAEAIADVKAWPSWWKAVKEVHEVKHATADYGVGSIYHHVWQSALPYKIRFTIEVAEVVPFKRIVGLASGDLAGQGIWEFSYVNGFTIAKYTWSVRTTKLWMNIVAPVARPIFRWAHLWVMKDGETGLRALTARTHRLGTHHKDEQPQQKGSGEHVKSGSYVGELVAELKEE